jgi:DNA polymerase III epsilon subunit-like protein
MHFCIQLHDWFYQETVATADTASIAARQLKQHHQRRTPSTSPPPPPPPARIPVEELTEELQRYKLDFTQRFLLGYPMGYINNPSKASMYINPPQKPKPAMTTSWDVNAPEFVPGSQTDSGRSSWGSTPRSDSDEETDTVEHECVRCDRPFRMTRDGEYVKEEACFHHWGRVENSKFSCCNKLVGSSGCTMTRFHVWNGTKRGMNGPFEGYVRARLPRGGVYAIDAEMCYTTAGFELAAIAVIAADGHIVYKEYVKPTAPVVDYNTRFSGIRPRDLLTADKTLRDVQNDILGFVGTDTILIGHALENDLRALKLIHSAVVDTSDMYPHARRYPMRRPLRTLCTEFLGRKVKHRKGGGHSPVEDARAALDLVLLRIHEEREERRNGGSPKPQSGTKRVPMFLPYDPLMCAA